MKQVRNKPKAANIHCWHNVTSKDQKRIKCQAPVLGMTCDKPATICEHSGTGPSFWYWCEGHGAGFRLTLPEYKPEVTK